MGCASPPAWGAYWSGRRWPDLASAAARLALPVGGDARPPPHPAGEPSHRPGTPESLSRRPGRRAAGAPAKLGRRRGARAEPSRGCPGQAGRQAPAEARRLRAGAAGPLLGCARRPLPARRGCLRLLGPLASPRTRGGGYLRPRLGMEGGRRSAREGGREGPCRGRLGGILALAAPPLSKRGPEILNPGAGWLDVQSRERVSRAGSLPRVVRAPLWDHNWEVSFEGRGDAKYCRRLSACVTPPSSPEPFAAPRADSEALLSA